MQSSGQTYGQSLPDQVERIAALFDVHLELISDVRELYNSRAALEREYAAKLQTLSKKAVEKKYKVEVALAVGEHPTKAWDSNTVMQNSLISAYTELVESMVHTAQDHVNIADSLTSQVVEVLRGVEKKNEEARKTEIQFFQKLLSDRDRIYAERLKSKQKYDEQCNEVESYRQKQVRAQDDKHAERAAKQSEQQRNEMLNSKNAYLISITVANNAKAQFYDASLPALEDQFQQLQQRLVERFAKILQHSQSLQLRHLVSLKNRTLFIDHNIRPFIAPDDWTFEPCITHYDTSDISVESAPKIVLQNKLNRCRLKIQELTPLLDAKRKELEHLSSQFSSYQADHTLGPIDELIENLLEARHQFALDASSERLLRSEEEAISSAIGDNEGSQRPHSFKSSTFSIPTQCGFCKTTIWGLSKQGKTCKLCGVSVHTKCELKIPADCEQGSVISSRSTISAGSTMTRTGSRVSTSSSTSGTSSFIPQTASETSKKDHYPTVRVLFDFRPTSEYELEVSEGETVHVVEANDGSGWVKVADMQGKDGLVPASYLERGDPNSQTPATRGDSCQRVRAVYAYEAQGPDELSLADGQTVELTSGPSGGQNYGSGWWEGIDSTGRRGIFPSNYVEYL
ncbi:hypothetical protein E4T56_gene16386 [Termitomyces sp. T112]|nr:hypothetical protein E4T56_gene16386 [Termitomyces sp. T112]